MAEKIVRFDKYCNRCEHWTAVEDFDICDECLSSPANEDSRKPINFVDSDPKRSTYGYYETICPIKKYLYAVEYNDIDYDFAKKYFEKSKDISNGIGGCSVFKHKQYVGRKLDWTYNNQSEFIVRTSKIDGVRHKSIGIGGGISALTDDFVKSGDYSDLYKVIPCNMYDGINECGVFANVNVVPTDYGKNTVNVGQDALTTLNGQMLVRYILDNFSSAAEAVRTIVNHVNLYFSKQLHDMDYEIHYFICDLHDTYVLEIVDNKYKILNLSYKTHRPEVMTNFHLYKTRINFDGTVYTPKFRDGEKNAHSYNRITDRGSGLERYNLIVNCLKDAHDKEDIWEILNLLDYTRAYSTSKAPSNPYWYSEFVGNRGLTVASEPSEFEPVVQIAGERYLNRSRETGDTWQSVHSVLYDLENKSMEVITQEDGRKLTYKL